jgi:hypothetical protein
MRSYLEDANLTFSEKWHFVPPPKKGVNLFLHVSTPPVHNYTLVLVNPF